MERFLGSILASLKTIRLTQLAAAAVVLFGSAAATFGVYDRVANPASLDQQENVQIIPVQYGDLIKQVSTSGNLTFPNRSVLRFGSQGTVAEIMVADGDRVAAGQPLARLDENTIAVLRLDVTNARNDAAAARRALDELLDPNGTRIANARLKVAEQNLSLSNADEAVAEMAVEHDEALVLAQEAVADAQVVVHRAQEALLDFPGEFHQSQAEARLLVAESRLALDRAQEDLSEFGADHPDDLANAVQAGANAQLKLEAAQDSLAEFQPDHSRALVQARDRLAAAEVALTTAQDSRNDFQSDYLRRLAKAQQALANAREGLREDRQTLEAYEGRNSNRYAALRETRDDLTATVNEMQSDLDRLLEQQANGTPGLVSHIWRIENSLGFLNEELSETVDLLIDLGKLEAAVEVSETLLAQAQSDLERLELGPDQLRKAELAAAAELAQSDLDQAKQDLRALANGPNPAERTTLEAAVEVAQVNLDQRRKELENLQKGPDALLRQQLLSAREKAQLDLAAAEDALEDLVQIPPPEVAARYLAAAKAEAPKPSPSAAPQNPRNSSNRGPASAADGDPGRTAQAGSTENPAAILAAILAGADHRDLELRRAALASAQITLSMAQQDLESLQTGLNPFELSLQRAEVAAAKSALTEAEADLAEILRGRLSQEARQAQAKLDSAQNKLENAIHLHEDAEIRSPINGFVSKVNVEQGDPANANTIIVEVVDPSVVEVDGVIDEIDVLLISVGTPTDITLDALPGQTLRGAVAQISPAPLNQQGVVSYPIRVTVEAPEGVALREGLTTIANILLQEQRNVLLIPQQSLYGTFDNPLVRLVNGEGTTKDTAVELGNSDDFWIEVRAGLKEGDRLAMETAGVATTGAGFRGLRGPSGGGSRGGRGPR